MLSGKLQNFLQGYHGIAIGTRDVELTPDFVRVLGTQPVGENRIKCFIDAPTSGTGIANILENGMIALVVASVTTFECYQFKGRYIHHRPASEEELQAVDVYLSGISELMEKMLGLPPRLAYLFPHTDMYILEMEVDDIFEQTPKQGTGQRMS